MTRWIELPISEGIRVSMAAASIAVCGFEHGVRQIAALGLTGHVNPCLPP
jgi:probable phosphoglycerate mutase